MKISLFFTAICSLLLASGARAQWMTETYSFKGGWNAIYLHGDASYDTLDVLLASGDAANIEEVWQWSPNPNQVQFIESPLIPSAGTPEWRSWVRGGNSNTLSALQGQAAYLVKCAGTVANSYSVPLKQSALPPSANWVRNGANLLGFPSLASTTPTFSRYFATFPAAVAANTKIYKYVGGELGPSNPQQIFAPVGEALDRTKAYWFSAEVVGNFYAPFEISLSSSGGLAFGRTGEVIVARIRNRTNAPVTLTLASKAENAGDVPSSQAGATGPVPLTRLTYNPTTLDYTAAPIIVNTPYPEVVGPQSTIELRFGINRGDAAMAGAANRSLFASFLRITDSGNLIDISIPATAMKDSSAGLWVGDIELTDVSNRVSNSARAAAVLTDGALTGLTVIGSGGYGYETAPEVTVAPPAGTAIVSAELANGAVSGFAVTHAGFDYDSAPMVTISAPAAGVTATGSASVAGGVLTSILVTDPGYFYPAAPLLTVADPAPSITATASASITGDAVNNLALIEPGSYYAEAPLVTISAPTSGTTATAVATVFDGAVTGFTITEPGSGYTAAPTVSLAAPPSATTATALATVVDGAVTGFTILEPGNGYLSAPTISVDPPPAATTATANVTLSGSIIGLSLTEGGTGYTVAPAVTIAAPAVGVTATAEAILEGDVVTGFTITDPGSGYDSVPVVTIAAPASGTTATADAVFSAIVIGVTIADAGGGYASPPSVTIASPASALTATATAVVANGSVAGFTVTSPGSGYDVAPRVTIAAPPPLQGTSTARSFPLRTLLHVNEGGTSRLLSQVFLGRLDAAPDYAFGLCTRESLLKQDALATAQRIVAAHMPPGQVITGSGSIGAGAVSFTITIPYNDATNPLVHRYHPDHDNKDARFNPIALPAGVTAATARMSDGVEAPAITRVCTFNFTSTGGSSLGGTYSEVITGTHKNPIQVSGTFRLNRASEIGTLTQ